MFFSHAHVGKFIWTKFLTTVFFLILENNVSKVDPTQAYEFPSILYQGYISILLGRILKAQKYYVTFDFCIS